MSATQIFDITDRAAWKQRRARDVTGSRVAAIYGAHPYLTPVALAQQLREGAVADHDNPEMRAGRILEPGVAIAIKEDHPTWRLTKATTYHRIPELRLGATPDYWLDDDGLIEIATVSDKEWMRLIGRPPPYKVLQAQCQLLVTGRARGKVAVLVRDAAWRLPLHIFDVPWDAGVAAQLAASVTEWWREFDAGKVPKLPMIAAPAFGMPATAAGTEQMATTMPSIPRAVLRF
jgi:putative phage-type endonuclease